MPRSRGNPRGGPAPDFGGGRGDWRGERGQFPARGPELDGDTLPQAAPPEPVTEAGPSPEAAAGPSPEAAAALAAPVVDTDATTRLLGDLESQRASVFYRVAGVVALLVLAALPVLPGPLWLRVQTGALSVLAALTALALGVVVRRPAQHTHELAALTGAWLTTLAIGIMYFLGLFSAAATLLSVGIYFYGSSQSRTVARLVYGTCAGLYFVLTASIALDLLPDLGVFSAAGVPRASRLYRVVMQQAIFAMTFYLARSGRRATQLAVERAQQVDRELRQREAQLLEARGELDRALRQSEGRLTGQLLDRYDVGDLLGRGGMGEVYAAVDTETGGPVAIKLLHANMLDDPANVQRFLREAKATAAVPSEHVPALLEVGTTPDGAPFLVMELLEGHDLGWYLRRTPQLALEQVVEMVEHTARALSAVREAGVVHRDLKPANLFLTDSIPRRWKVLDFGLSKLQGASSLTKDQAVGTPAYMAPEQIRGKEVDHLTDLYALAAIAYRAITGRPPFVGDEVAKVLMDVLTRIPESPGTFAKVPVEVELVLAVGLAKRRSDRFASVEELAVALRLAARGELDAATRQRGWSLLKQHPWGSTIRRR